MDREGQTVPPFEALNPVRVRPCPSVFCLGYLLLAIACCAPARAQVDNGNFIGSSLPQRPTAAELEYQKQLRQKLHNEFIPIDPWRVIHGQTNYARGGAWQHFWGRVTEVKPDGGVILIGDYSTDYGGDPLRLDDGRREYFVAHFPNQMVDGAEVSRSYNYTAHFAGTYTYLTAIGDRKTVTKLDYGTPTTPPVELVEAARSNAQAYAESLARARAEHLAAADRTAFEFYARAATNGNDAAQLRLAEFYLAGRGTSTNAALARHWLTRAAGAGNTNAATLLQSLRKP